MPVFSIGFFLSITNDDGILKLLGFGIYQETEEITYLRGLEIAELKEEDMPMV